MLLHTLKSPSFASSHAETARTAEREGWGFERYLHVLAELEISDREVRKIERLRRSSQLPPDKTAATLDLAKIPTKVRRLLPALYEGRYVDEGENLLAFGLPGRGKSHCLCAVGHELVARGYPMDTKAFVLALAVVGAVALTASADAPAPVRDLTVTGTLTVTAPDGRSSVQLQASEGGVAHVMVMGPKGAPRVVLRLSPAGAAELSLTDAVGRPRVDGSVEAPGPSSLSVSSGPAGACVEMRAARETVYCSTFDPENRPRAVVGLVKGREAVRTLNADGETTGQLGAKQRSRTGTTAG